MTDKTPAQRAAAFARGYRLGLAIGRALIADDDRRVWELIQQITDNPDDMGEILEEIDGGE